MSDTLQTEESSLFNCNLESDKLLLFWYVYFDCWIKATAVRIVFKEDAYIMCVMKGMIVCLKFIFQTFDYDKIAQILDRPISRQLQSSIQR